MKRVQSARPGGGKRVGLVEGDRVLDITAPREGIDERVYDSRRPKLFFKATAGRCAGPDAAAPSPVAARSGLPW